MAEPAPRTPKEDLLVGGLTDWADASWAAQSARLSGVQGGPALRDLTLGLVAEVLREGLMVPGYLFATYHLPWPCDAEEAAARIAQEWIDEWGDDVPTPGAIVWLNNTEAGDEVAQAVLAREANR